MQPCSANDRLVDRLIAEGALWSKPLIAAFRATPRHYFLDRVFQFQRKHNRWREILTRDPGPEELRLLYSDRALITHLSRPNRQAQAVPVSSSSQPSLMAQMLEDLRLAPDLKVLEIGAGTGYNAALLAHVVGPGRVTAVDVDRAVLSEAWDHLRAVPERGVALHHADGREGYPDAVPYERLIVTAATPDVEPAWLEQLADEGLLLAPLSLAPGLAFVVRGTAHAGVFHGRLLRAAYFMPLRAEGEDGAEDLAVPPTAQTRSLAAPWAGWFDRRRPRTSWLAFIQALALFGLLRGLAVHYQTAADGEATFGVANGIECCWLGSRRWQVSGHAGQVLGTELWRAFLDAGGPRPTDYEIQAGPGARWTDGGDDVFIRQGIRCRQRWQLAEVFDRPAWL
jgi:protein-L-isoaspartate(D-aspartate) O-methyltransferase